MKQSLKQTLSLPLKEFIVSSNSDNKEVIEYVINVVKEEQKSLLMKAKEESEKVGFKA